MPSYTFTVNSVEKTIAADADTPLLWILRDALDLTGTKYSCGIGSCGACTILLNEEAVRSCVLSIEAASRADIITIEGLSDKNDHPLQLAWKALDVPQCGYCQSGMIMSAASLLSKNPAPTKDDITAAMQGNICRCGTYSRVLKAIETVAAKIEK